MSIFDAHKDGSDHHGEFAQALAQGDFAQAYAEYETLKAQDKTPPLAAEAVYPLASAAHAKGDEAEALAIIEGFSNHHPHHPDVVKNYLLVAEILKDHYGKTAEARALLEHLSARYPQATEMPQIAELLFSLQTPAEEKK